MKFVEIFKEVALEAGYSADDVNRRVANIRAHFPELCEYFNREIHAAAVPTYKQISVTIMAMIHAEMLLAPDKFEERVANIADRTGKTNLKN